MDKEQNFKEWVKNAIIQEAPNYYNQFIKRHYLIYSSEFKNNPFYEAEAKSYNYKHLTGVSSSLNGHKFFYKAIKGTLSMNDFEISRDGISDAQAKAIIRDKIKVLPLISSLFTSDTEVVEGYHKVSFTCSFAASNNNLVIGYSPNKPYRPMSLLRINQNMLTNKVEPLLILSGPSSTKKYDTLVKGTYFDIVVAYPTLRNYLSIELIGEVAEEIPSILIYREIYNYFDAFPNYIYS